MGTPDFARKPLERLYDDGHDITAVFTQPDRPNTRGMKVRFSPVKELAASHDTPVFQPVSLKDGTAEKALRELSPDLIAVVAYGKLLPPDILGIPPKGCINIHASLLPELRGAAPIQWAVLNGAKETGVTSMFMAEELDAGDILLARKTSVDEQETAGELQNRLSMLGAELLSETIVHIDNGTAIRKPQNHADATFAPPLSKSLSPIDWSMGARHIMCRVRGLNPWPIATAEFGGTLLKVFSVEISVSDPGKRPGEIVDIGRQGLKVACADGIVTITELQAPGGKRMAASDYLRGNPVI